MWLVSAASLAATIANIYKARWCFFVWLVCNILWVLYDVDKNAIPQAALMAIYAGLAVLGIFKWRKTR
jgi:nicotinamide riboside transporter PnuC